MKKIPSLLIIISVITALMGCGSEEKTVKGIDNKTETKETSEIEEDVETLNGHTAEVVNFGLCSVSGTNVVDGVLGVAVSEGFFKEELDKIGVKIEFFGLSGAGPAVNEAMASGDLDVGMIGEFAAITAKASGVDTTLLCNDATPTPTSVIVAKDSDIKELKDLIGKKVAYPKGTCNQQIFINLLKKEGILIDEINVVNAAYADMPTLLLAGEVDAIVSVNVDAIVSLVKDGSLRFLVNGNENEDCIAYGNLVIRTEFLQENPDIAIALLKGYKKAIEYANTDSEILKNQWASSGAEKDIFEFLWPDGIVTDSELVVTEEKRTAKQEVVQFMLENELISDEVEVDDWYNPVYAQQAEKELEDEKE